MDFGPLKSEIDQQLDKIKGVTKQRAAIKLQLQFRQKVLSQQASDKTLFHVTAGGRQKPLRVLKENLITLVEACQEPGEEVSGLSTCNPTIVDYIANPHILIGKRYGNSLLIVMEERNGIPVLY